MTESYIFRRLICEIPANSLNKTFAVMKNKIDKNHYLESIKARYVLLDNYKEFPRDNKFLERFVEKDIYHMRARNYILSKLERFENKEKLDLTSFTIEHIMPENENLKYDWKDVLGENWKDIHAKYLHTIGNLTLTAYNSEMSDRSFYEKLRMDGGFLQSGLRLNSYVRQQTEWNGEKIVERAKELSEKAIKIWAYPEISDELIDKYAEQKSNKNAYDMDYHMDKFSTETIKLYNELDRKIMNLDANIFKEYTKLYIAYKLDTNFVDIIPQKDALKLVVNIEDFANIYDPEGLCENVTDKGKWGNGNVRIRLSKFDKIDYAIKIIQQAIDEQID